MQKFGLLILCSLLSSAIAMAQITNGDFETGTEGTAPSNWTEHVDTRTVGPLFPIRNASGFATPGISGTHVSTDANSGAEFGWMESTTVTLPNYPCIITFIGSNTAGTGVHCADLFTADSGTTPSIIARTTLQGSFVNTSYPWNALPTKGYENKPVTIRIEEESGAGLTLVDNFQIEKITNVIDSFTTATGFSARWASADPAWNIGTGADASLTTDSYNQARTPSWFGVPAAYYKPQFHYVIEGASCATTVVNGNGGAANTGTLTSNPFLIKPGDQYLIGYVHTAYHGSDAPGAALTTNQYVALFDQSNNQELTVQTAKQPLSRMVGWYDAGSMRGWCYQRIDVSSFVGKQVYVKVVDESNLATMSVDYLALIGTGDYSEEIPSQSEHWTMY